mgnify:CR=1 FL=1
MGENARKAKYKVLGRVIKRKLSFDTYLITLPSNPSNILDMYPANVLLQSHYKKKAAKDDVYIVGIAKGRDEACELVRDIVDEVYSNTGDFDISRYLKFGMKR